MKTAKISEYAHEKMTKEVKKSKKTKKASTSIGKIVDEMVEKRYKK